MTDLVAHGIEVSLPAGWEGRLFRRPRGGEVAAADANISGAPAAAEETTNAILHVSTIALPREVGDFASGAVDLLGAKDVMIVLFEYDPESVEQPLFRARGIPRRLEPDDFSPNVMQRAIKGQCGVQRFFNDEGRAFCLYVVLGSFAHRQDTVPRVNEVLATLTIDPVEPSSTTTTAPTTTTTTVPPNSTTTTVPPDSTTTTEPPTTTVPPPTGDAP